MPALKSWEVKERKEVPLYTVSCTFESSDFDELRRVVKPGHRVHSELFAHPSTPGMQWRILVNPCGDVEQNKGHVSVFLEASSGVPQDALVFLSSGGTKIETDDPHSFTDADPVWGTGRLLSHENLVYSAPGLFVVTATVKYQRGEAKTVPSKPVATPPDFSELLLSDKLSDFALKVGSVVVKDEKRLKRGQRRR